MKVSKMMHKMAKPVIALSTLAIGSLGMAMAADAEHMSFADLSKNMSSSADWIIKLFMIVVTVAGVMLVLKGIVHLKQNYTSGGGGQEKHLSKGIASLAFGACLFIVVPITHVLVGGISGTSTQYNEFTIAGGEAQSLS